MNLKFGWLYVLLFKFIYFNSDAQRFSPNLAGPVSPKLCETAKSANWGEDAFDL